MIFVTVGTQLPFNRLTRAVASWCQRSGRGREVFGQIGALSAADHRPRAFPWVHSLDPAEFDRRIGEAQLVVSHAGMGSIIAALGVGTPILVLPRRAALGEQRSDHQIATARRFSERPGVSVAAEAEEIPDLIDAALNTPRYNDAELLPPFADPGLIDALRRVIRASEPQ